MNKEKLNNICESKRFDVIVDWHTGDVTKETVIADDGKYYYFDFDSNGSYYAPHDFCKKIF